MEDLVIVTGALGHLGSMIVRDLLKMGKKVRGFDLKKGSHGNLTSDLITKIDLVYGDITNNKDIERLFKVTAKTIYVIHCAAIVTISSFPDSKVYEVNVNGTKNIIKAALRHKVKRFIYVSSVHAIPEGRKGSIIKEVNHFNPKQVVGLYAKTKAEASQYALESAAKGLDISIVHPSGIIGPFDYGNNHLTRLLINYYNDKLTTIVQGGYDFVDVRDVSKGIIKTLFKGKKGRCYILSNQYFTIPKLIDLAAEVCNKTKVKSIIPIWVVKGIALLVEINAKIKKTSPLFTLYSMHTLQANANFSHQRATQELDYHPRPIKETIKDTMDFIAKNKLK